jgi:predicted metal-dependent HD superfamily phosphohydrolase
VAVLIDPPQWPAHGTLFSHLVSDDSLAELLFFADANDVPVRAFDHDHYDVAERRYADLVAAGARAVPASELVRRLVSSGLRVRTPDRTPKAAQVLPGLRAAWAGLLPDSDRLGRELLRRWQEPHRHYHDVRHLAQLLSALAELCGGPPPRPLALAAWFHDAVHEGTAGADERDSAELALTELGGIGLPGSEVAEVARLVLLTIDHSPEPGDNAGALLVDGDLSILGQPPGRYHYYSRGIRLEYPTLSDELFFSGRLQALDQLLSKGPLFGTSAGRGFWEVQARGNLDVERLRWSKLAGTEQAGKPGKLH